MKITTLGIDLAKNVFRVHGCDARGKVVVSKSLTRRQLPEFMAKLSPCLVGMEACATAHYWVREIQKFGHQVRLMSTKFVQPYVKNNKNDSRDAEAICEAVQRPTMPFVAVKSPAQQDVQALHRVRHQLVKELPALSNQVRETDLGISAPERAAADVVKLPAHAQDIRVKLVIDRAGIAMEPFSEYCRPIVATLSAVAEALRRSKFPNLPNYAREDHRLVRQIGSRDG